MAIQQVYQKVKRLLIAALILSQLYSCTLHYNATIDSRKPHYNIYGKVSGTYSTTEEKRRLKKEPVYVDLSGWNIK